MVIDQVQQRSKSSCRASYNGVRCREIVHSAVIFYPALLIFRSRIFKILSWNHCGIGALRLGLMSVTEMFCASQLAVV